MIVLQTNPNFQVDNKYQIPKLKAITLNVNLGILAQNEQKLKYSINCIRTITGQHPTIIRSKKTLPEFKIKKRDIIGIKVTLRKEKMFCFFDRLILIYLPRLKDFNGISSNKISNDGSITIGFSTFVIFPEIAENILDPKIGVSVHIFIKSKVKTNISLFLKQHNFPLIQ
jgi:large subunit ribosomal protein L5